MRSTTLLLALASTLPALGWSLPLEPASAQAVLDLPSGDLSSQPLYRPVVIWHGLGDFYSSEGMTELAGDLEIRYPGLFVHNVRINDDVSKDRKAGFFGNVNEQIDAVATQLKAIPELAGGYDAIGFSQGGQFLRGLVELYGAPVRNLICFGSQMMGVSDLPVCAPTDFVCKVARSAAFRGVYSSYAQENLVQAQYFRDQDRLDLYLKSNTFLAVINNELESKDASFKTNLESLDNLVLLRFRNETTVSPPISSHFGSLLPVPALKSDISSDVLMLEERETVPLRDSQLYKEDWIGLKTLDERGGLEFGWCDGMHMQISLDKGGCWDEAVSRWVGTLA